MKIRQGFVSNSSSSSFIVVSKNGELTKEKIIKVFDIGKKSPLYSVVENISTSILQNATLFTKDEFAKEYGYESFEKMKEEEDWDYMKIYEKSEPDWNIYVGAVSDYDSDDAVLVSLNLDIDTDEIILSKESYY